MRRPLSPGVKASALQWRKNEAKRFIEDSQSLERLCTYMTKARRSNLPLGCRAVREMWAGHFRVIRDKSEMLQNTCRLMAGI